MRGRHVARALGSVALVASVALACVAAACRDAPDAARATDVSSATARMTAPSATPDAVASAARDGGGSRARRVAFVALGDGGKGNEGAKRVARAIAKKCAADGCDFALLLGDNVYESGLDGPDDAQMIEKFENVYEPVNVPFHPVLGNHDYGHAGLGTDFEKGIHEVLYSQRSKKWKMPDAYYALSFGVLDTFALDTNMANFDRAAEESRVMSAKIQSSTAPWKIAYGHHPYVSNGPHGNAGQYNGLSRPASFSGASVKGFLEDVACGRVDAYLAGHDHSMQWVVPTCRGTELLVSGAAAETTTLPGHNETHFQSTDLGFVYGVATETELSFEFVNDANQSLYKRTITKPGRATESERAP